LCRQTQQKVLKSSCKVPDVLPVFNQIWNISTDFHIQVPSIKCQVNASSRSRPDTCGRTGRETDGPDQGNKALVATLLTRVVKKVPYSFVLFDRIDTKVRRL
jgi:hypothetical protein